MSDLLDSRLTPEQLQECAKNDALMGIKTAHGITRTGPAKVSGVHLSDAANEPASLDVADELAELNALECALLRADMQRNVNKGERLARQNDAYALEIQLQGYIGGVVR